MTGDVFPYASAQAFGAALTDRFRQLATNSGHTASQLWRQFAYDRLLARLFHNGSREWILKGGVSMIARLGRARHTADVDLAARADSVDDALTALQEAANKDLGDFFTFRFEPPRALIQGLPGLRLPTEAWLGHRMFERFGIDLVIGATPTAPIESAPPLLPLVIEGLIRPPYRLYPLVDSIADKVMATIEPHHGRPSTRFRDLVDLVIIAHSKQVDADELAKAFTSERLRRSVPGTDQFQVPDESRWRNGYRTAAADVSSVAEKTLPEALHLAKQFIDPVLSGSISSGVWDCAKLTWQPDRSQGER